MVSFFDLQLFADSEPGMPPAAEETAAGIFAAKSADGPSPARQARPFEDGQMPQGQGGPGASPKQNGQPAASAAAQNPAEKPVDLNFAQAFADAQLDYDPGQAQEFKQVLTEAGVKDNAVANRLAGYVLAQQGKAQEALYAEAVREFGGTPAEPGEKFEEAQIKAGRAIEALEMRVPGLRAALSRSPLDYDVRVLKALAVVGDMVGEDGSSLGGGAAHAGAGVASMYFPNSR
jgi:hypothetical protein